ncbi:MAG: DNA internalization-related competence protein ComEC/Rec2 [Gammaproteobacteria bacterium]|nr:DNA internalization-related competence protein ComEC/Rec2 [Gammaproteobacteria bacterium]
MLAVHQLPRLPGAAWLVPAAILTLLALGGQSSPEDCRAPWPRAPRAPLVPRTWLLAALAAATLTAASAAARLDDRLPPELLGGDFAVTGWVDGFPSGPAERTTFSFRVERAEDPAVPRRLRLAWYGAPSTLAAGAAFDLTVRLRPPRGTLNPGGFDYERWLLVEGYGATGYVRSGAAAPDRSPSLARAWMRARRAVADDIAAAAPGESAAALVTALAIGERFGFTEQQWEALRRSGTSHLVAISGMHVGLVAGFVFFAARRLWLRLPAPAVHYDLEAAAALSLAAAIGYAALAGFAVPTQRAVVMTAVALGIVAARRRVGAANGIAAAAVAVTALDPFAVLGASFWMSFGAVALLVWLALRYARRAAKPAPPLARLRSHVRALVLLQLAVGVGLVPITVLFFGEVSFVAPFVNLLAIPYFTLVLVPLTLTAVLAACVGVPGADALIHAAGVLADVAWTWIHAAGGAPFAAAGVSQPQPVIAALALLGAAAALPAHPLPGRSVAWLALLPLVSPFQHRVPEGAADVTMLDVGHGLAVVVETRRHRLLYDAGPSFPSGYDSGADVVLPALARRRWAGLDRVVVSHSDNDHAGGIAAVLRAWPDADVLKGPDVEAFGGRVCAAGQRWTWDGVVFDVLHPAPDFSWRGNESSCVLKITTRHGSVLIPGDAESRAERELALRPDVAADVVVIGHHGSRTSSTPAFVAATGARHALASAGHANRWGFPAAEVVRRWRDAGARLWVTADEGAVEVRLRDGRIELGGQRRARLRYWRSE